VIAENAVHETRKALKRLRALIRLLEGELGEQVAARENAVLRDAGRRLAGTRDTEVLVGTLDGLIKRHPKKLVGQSGVVKLHERLVAERDIGTERVLGDAATRAEVIAELRAARGRVAEWNLLDDEGIEMVEPGLRRVYRQGRRRWRLAVRAKDDSALAMHQWRKRVKDLRYAAEMLDRHDPTYRADAHRATQGTGKRKRTERRGDGREIHRLARRADQLGELLGEEHDLVLLNARVLTAGKPSNGADGGADGELGGGTRKILLKLIARRRRRLRSKALRQGERIYRRRPKAFLARVRDAYARESHP
jgi:CHAD domain